MPSVETSSTPTMQLIAATALLLNITKPRYLPDQLSYTTQAIQKYVHHHGSYCLFLDSGSVYNYDNFLNEILRHPRMTSVPRVVFNGHFQGPDAGGRFPSLLLVEGSPNALESYSWIYKLFYHKIDHNTRTILFAPTTFARNVKFQQKMLVDSRIHNVAVVSTDERKVFYMRWKMSKLVELPYPPAVGELFRYQMKDSARYEFVYSLKRRSLDIYRSIVAPVGAAIRWADETARYLNGTSSYQYHKCHEYSKVWSACYRKFLTTNKISYSLDGIVLADNELNFTWRMLQLSIPYSAALLVPEPELLGRSDLLAVVMRMNSALVIVAVILCTELIFLFSPFFTMGDSLLYATSATLPFDFRAGKYLEKCLLVLVMVVVLIITHEYIAHLKALIIDRPFAKHFNSLDDFQASSLNITTDLLQLPELREDPRFSQRIRHDDETHHRFSGKQAYILDSELAEILLPMKINYDIRYGRRRYRQLEDSINVNVQYRVLLPMHQFLPKFVYTERVFFESGIWQHWTREHRWTMDGPLWKKLGGDVGNDDRVGRWTVGDLQLAWMTLVVGYAVGLVLLLMELWCHWF